MRILVLGAGVIGVTTAYELAKSGHNVTVLDRKPKPGLETSYGNAGLIAPGHSYAWTTPKLPKNLFKSLFQKKKAFRFKFQWDPAMWVWGVQFLRQCTQNKMEENTLRKHRLSSYSQKCFHRLINEIKINYHENKKGLIYIFRTRKSFEEGTQKLAMLKSVMGNLQLLNETELIQLEPVLKGVKEGVHGGIYCPSDESGNCRDFTIKLSEICKQRGGNFHFNTTVKEIESKGDKIRGVITDRGNYEADVYVLACAAYSSSLAKTVGDYLPIYPVKGYSITLPIIDVNMAPVHSGIDEDNLLAFSLLGDKIRFTSVAEISGYDTNCSPKDFTEIVAQASSLFPKACDYSKIEYWCGLRPMTPNGSPIFGKGKMDNLYYNTGHGHLGWTMCSGSAKITTDLILGNKPDLDLEGMTIANS